MNWTPYYILDDAGHPRAVDVMAWCAWWERHDRTVARTDLGDVVVSTVFLGLDHQRGIGPPILWETMVFASDGGGYTRRYATRAAAEQGHADTVDNIRRWGDPAGPAATGDD